LLFLKVKEIVPCVEEKLIDTRKGFIVRFDLPDGCNVTHPHWPPGRRLWVPMSNVSGAVFDEDERPGTADKRGAPARG